MPFAVIAWIGGKVARVAARRPGRRLLNDGYDRRLSWTQVGPAEGGAGARAEGGAGCRPVAAVVVGQAGGAGLAGGRGVYKWGTCPRRPQAVPRQTPAQHGKYPCAPRPGASGA